MEKNKPALSLKKWEEIAAACNRCGFCTSYCPTYNATGSEVQSPRGRNQMVRALIEGKIENPVLAKESIDTCLLCGECTSVCFSEVPTARLMVEAREYLNQQLGIPKPFDFFLRWILPFPNRMKWLLKASFIAKNLGIPFVLRKTGLLKKFFPTLNAADALLDKAPKTFLLDNSLTYRFQERRQKSMTKEKMLEMETVAEKTPAAPSAPKVAYLPVCGSQYLRPSIGMSTIKLFYLLKVDFMIPETICCGLPASSYGVADRAKEMACENIRRLEKGRYDQIVVDDSSCAAQIKEWAQSLQSDPEWVMRAHDMVQKHRDLSSFLNLRGLKDHLKLAPWTGGAVAFHDPCKARYAQKLVHPPRELLGAIPRLNLVPIGDADQCCGGAGTYSFVHPDVSRKVLEAKIDNIIATGCKIVVTSSASCLTQLAFGLREKKSDIEALHLTEFLVRALEKKQ